MSPLIKARPETSFSLPWRWKLWTREIAAVESARICLAFLAASPTDAAPAGVVAAAVVALFFPLEPPPHPAAAATHSAATTAIARNRIGASMTATPRDE